MKEQFKFDRYSEPQLLKQCLKKLALYKHRYKSRKTLLNLDDDLLKDIGLSREQAEKEGRIPFWKGDNFETKISTNQHSRKLNLDSI